MMTSVVVDTHVVIWDWLDPDRISTKARRAITEADNNHQLVICEISFWEIAMLLRRKRISSDIPYLDFISDLFHSRNYIHHGITPEIAYLATEIDIATRDPADRLIAATSIYLGLPLLTSDASIQGSNMLKTIW